MNYVERNLGKNEKIVTKAKISWLTLVPRIIWLAICVAIYFVLKNQLSEASNGKVGSVNSDYLYIILVVGVIPLIAKIIVNASCQLAVTNKRLVGKIGVFKINTVDAHIDKVDNVSYKAGFFGNIFHYYEVTIQSVGGAWAKFKGISNALEFKNKVNEAIEQHAEEARKIQASEIAAAMHNN